MKINLNSNFLGIHHAFSAWLLALFVFGVSPAVLAQSRANFLETQQSGVNARIEVLGQAFTTPYPIEADQSRIMVYRSAQGAVRGSTSVFVDGRYHTSLVPGAWSALCYRSGRSQIGARQMEVGSRPKDAVDSLTEVLLQGGQTHYLRVNETSDRVVMEPVPAAKAHQEMANAKEQIHTVSRVAQACREGAAAPVTATGPLRITLPADTLFAFNRSDVAAMTSSGLTAMDNLLAMLKANFSRVDGMNVIGHADPLGNVQANEKLSLQRAQTVSAYLQARGLSGQDGIGITTEGRGDRDPVISTCGRQINARSIACNLPNRRVTVEVTGQRK